MIVIIGCAAAFVLFGACEVIVPAAIGSIIFAIWFFYVSSYKKVIK